MGYVVSAKSADPYTGVILEVEQSPEDRGSNPRISATRFGGGTAAQYQFILKGHFTQYLVDSAENNDDVLEDSPPSTGATINRLYIRNTGASNVGQRAARPVWHKGAGAPDTSLGVDGDWYFRESNRNIYKKASGSWATDNASDSDYAEPAFFGLNTDLSGSNTEAWQQDTDSVCASFANQASYPGPAAPRLTRTTQGSQQVTVFFAENERPLTDLAPITHAQWRTVTLPAGAVSRSTSVIASFDARGVLDTQDGTIFYLRDTGSTIKRYTIDTAGNADEEGTVVLSGGGATTATGLGAVAGGEYIVNSSDLWGRVSNLAYTFIGDLTNPGVDLSPLTIVNGTLYNVVTNQSSGGWFVDVREISPSDASLVSRPARTLRRTDNNGANYSLSAACGRGSDIYIVSSTGVLTADLIRIADVTGTTTIARIGPVTGLVTPNQATTAVWHRVGMVSRGEPLFLTIPFTFRRTARDMPHVETHLYRGTLSGLGLALEFVAAIAEADGTTVALGTEAFSGTLDRSGELAVSDTDSTDLQTLTIRYNSSTQIRLSATFDSGFSMFGKTLHINGVSTGSSGSGPWTIGTSHALWNELNTLMAGGTIGIEIYDTSSPVQYGAWQDLTCCVESSHVTIENLTNDQLIQVEVWNLDGSGKESNRVRENTFAQADPAPDPIPLVGTNTSGGALLQWHE